MPEGRVLFAAMGGVHPKTKLWNNLQERDYRRLKEFYAWDEKYLRVENVEEALRKADSLTKNSKDKKDKKMKHEKPKPNYQKWQRPKDRAPPALLSRYTYYTGLNTDGVEVFHANEGRVHFRRPFPIWKERAKTDHNKYCHYHCDVGHETNECHELKDEIEDLIRQGKLNNYVQAPRENRTCSKFLLP